MTDLKENNVETPDTTTSDVEISNAQFFKCLLKKFWDSFSWAIITIAVVIFIFSCVIFVGYIPSPSMENTLHVENFVIGNRFDKSCDKGDIVVFESEEYDCYLIKRVIATGGDSVEIREGKVFVNGSAIDEPYVVGTTIDPQENRIFEVPENCLFLLGDNREDSVDSRYFEEPYINESTVMCTAFATMSTGGDDGFFIKKIK